MINKFKEFESYLDDRLFELIKTADSYSQGEKTGLVVAKDKFLGMFSQELSTKLTMKQAMADAKVIQSCPGAFGFKNGLMKDSETQIKKNGITAGCRGVSCVDCWDRAVG